MKNCLIKFNNLKTCGNLFKFLFFERQTTKFLTNREIVSTIVSTATTSNSEEHLLNQKAAELVKSIVDEYANGGRMLALPWADEQVTFYLRRLLLEKS